MNKLRLKFTGSVGVRIFRCQRLTNALLVLVLCGSPLTWAAAQADNKALADIHLHYTWDQTGVTSPEDAIALLIKNHVALAVVNGTPPELALELQRAGGDWVVPIFSPYLTARHRQNWFTDPDVVSQARKALASKLYFGIGEVHLRGGLGPRRKNKILQQLIVLAAEYDVPFLIHIETSSEQYFVPLCRQHSKTRFLLAHAGGTLDANQIDRLLKACPNVWVEMSARDYWHYVDAPPIVDNNGDLSPDWVKVMKAWPDKFMTGSDTVWPVDYAHQWDQPDTGWQQLDRFLGFHRRWIRSLPDELANKVRLTNALQFFRNSGRLGSNE